MWKKGGGGNGMFPTAGQVMAMRKSRRLRREQDARQAQNQAQDARDAQESERLGEPGRTEQHHGQAEGPGRAGAALPPPDPQIMQRIGQAWIPLLPRGDWRHSDLFWLQIAGQRHWAFTGTDNAGTEHSLRLTPQLDAALTALRDSLSTPGWWRQILQAR